MKLFRVTILSFIVFFFSNCNKNSEKIAILLADREAPIGWISLKIYEDKSFEFISKGIFLDDVHTGIVKINHDTLYFKYHEEIPNLGKTAIINKKYIEFLDSPELIEIKLNKIN